MRKKSEKGGYQTSGEEVDEGILLKKLDVGTGYIYVCVYIYHHWDAC